MARFFIVDGKQLPDPDSRLTPDEVRAYLAANFYDWLANAETREERRSDDTHYTFTRRIGTKGAGSRRSAGPRNGRIRRLIRAAPEQRLRVWDLAAALTLPSGDIDHLAAAQRQPEIELALAECEASARATHAAAEALRRLRPR